MFVIQPSQNIRIELVDVQQRPCSNASTSANSGLKVSRRVLPLTGAIKGVRFSRGEANPLTVKRGEWTEYLPPCGARVFSDQGSFPSCSLFRCSSLSCRGAPSAASEQSHRAAGAHPIKARRLFPEHAKTKPSAPSPPRKPPARPPARARIPNAPTPYPLHHSPAPDPTGTARMF